MVRIIREEKPKEQAPPKLDHKSNVLLQVIGIILAENPDPVKKLLEEYSLELPAEPTEAELIDKLLFAIGEGSPEFNHDLATLLLDNTLDSSYDNFNFKSLLGKSGDGGDDGSGSGGNNGGNGSGGGGGGGLMGSITGAIGSIGNAVGIGLKNKQNKDQATIQTIQGTMAYRQQLSQTEQAKSKAKTQMMLGLFLLFGICLLALTSYLKKQSQPQEQPALING